MPALRILFTNNTLARPAGTELSLHDACLAMQQRGHIVAAFSSQLGEIADRLLKAGVCVFDSLDSAPWAPDVIHGQHEWESTLAAMRWPAVPVISFRRGPYLWQEAPCRMPNVVRYVAVDDACREKLEQEDGIPAEMITIVRNGVDLSRFMPRSPLPLKPKSALIFSNYASESNFAPAVRSACKENDIALTIIGASAGNPVPHPEAVLGDYDIVFAKGKAALEALATGCAVIVGDTAGLGEMVTPDNFEALRKLSFGNPCMSSAWAAQSVTQQLRCYDAKKGTDLALQVRSTCGLERTADQLEQLYIEASKQKLGANLAEMNSAARHLMERVTLAYKLGRKIQEESSTRRTGADMEKLTPEMADRLFSNFQRADEKLHKAQSKADELRAEISKLKARIERMKSEGAKNSGKLSKALGRLLGRDSQDGPASMRKPLE